MKKFFQIENFKENLIQFPLSFLAGLYFSFFMVLSIESDDKILSEKLFCYGASAFLAIFLFISLKFLKVSKIVNILAVAATVWFAIYFASIENINIKSYLFISLFIMLFVSLFWSYLYKKSFSSLQEWQHIDKVISSFAATVFFTLLIYAGAALALFAIDKLFDINIASKRYGELFFISAGVIGNNIFLTLLRNKPSKNEFNPNFALEGASDALVLGSRGAGGKRRRSRRVRRGFTSVPMLPMTNADDVPTNANFGFKIKKIISNILLGLSLVYFIILYIYTFYIALSFQLPKNILAWLITVFSAFSIATLLYYTPYFNSKTQKYKKVFFIALLPQIALLFFALFIRINEYGITINRYMIALYGVWILSVSLYFLFAKSPKYSVIFLLFSILIFISQLTPLSAYKVSEYSQTKRLKKLIQENTPLNKSPLKIKYQISSTISYLLNYHGIEPFKKIFPKYVKEYKSKKSYDYPRRKWIGFGRYLTRKLGFEYVSKWDYESNNTNRPKIVYLYLGNSVIDIKGYDYLFNADTSFNNFKQKCKIEPAAAYISLDKKTITVKAENKTVTVGLKNFFDKLRLDVSLTSDTDKKTKWEKLTYVFEDSSIKLKLIVTHLEISPKKEIEILQAKVLCKIKP